MNDATVPLIHRRLEREGVKRETHTEEEEREKKVRREGKGQRIKRE
jgi:hypothetical protein